MKLDLYNKKRHFKKTSEPKGKVSHQHKYLYVIQKHDASHLHYDFRLELNGVLLSWAIPKGPCLDPTIKRLAIHVEDHPVQYGHFEGIIPKGEYGGGTVMLWDEGKWIPENENPTAAYEKGHLHFQLIGKKLKGTWNLIRFKKNDDQSWFLIKAKDKYAKSLNQYDITLEKPNSVLTHHSLDKIAENAEKIWSKKGLKKITQKKSKKIKINLPTSIMPTEINPQLATSVEEVPSSNEWLHELKLDGYRMIAFKDHENVRLISRNQIDFTAFFKNIAHEIKKLPIKKVILDGEIVLLDSNQRSNFQLLQNAMDTQNKHFPFIYYIFDLIYYDQYNLKSLPLLERKYILQTFISDSKNTLRYNDHIIGSGPDVFKNACEMGLEGIISKRINSRYEEKRTKSWLKMKCMHRQEFVIGGYSLPKHTRQYFGSLYLGYFDSKQNLIYCGNVGTGFTQKSIVTVYNELKKIITTKNPFATYPFREQSPTWVKPKLVAEIEFFEFTRDGMLRQPSFKGLRKDKSPKSIHREIKIKEREIKSPSNPLFTQEKIQLPFKLTHPEKMLYPEMEITKLDLIEYYDQIQEWILPYIANRPLTLVRCPDHYSKCFYQKHINESTPPYLYGITIKENRKNEEDIYIKNRNGLMALVQIDTLEIHAWGSRIQKLEFPDILTFDLDPAPDVSWKKVVITAKRIKSHLADYNLQSFVKTTGGKGLHIVIPIKPQYEWKQVKEFAHVFVRFMVMNYPDEYIDKMSINQRKGKIFIDYLRNQRGATTICPYSTRARQDATVATPLDWNELTNNRDDTTYNIVTLLKRLKKLKKDPWEDFHKIKQSLRLNKKLAK